MTAKDLYEVGEIPPLGHVPEKMYAWAIRREREGTPDKAMQVETVPTWSLGPKDVLVLNMAAGVNYNGVWASRGVPVSMFDVHGNDFHVAGSDASGVVWAVGSDVTNWKVGDEVVQFFRPWRHGRLPLFVVRHCHRRAGRLLYLLVFSRSPFIPWY